MLEGISVVKQIIKTAAKQTLFNNKRAGHSHNKKLYINVKIKLTSLLNGV